MTASKRDIGSDLAKVDAYENTQADYDEVPDVSDRDPSDGVYQSAGVPKIGRPPLGERSKKLVSLRLDPDVIEAFKAAGPGWQSRINATLREAVARGISNAET